MIANVADKRQCVDFVLMMDVRIVMANGKVKGMTLPNRQTFEDRVGEAINIMVKENMEWCNVVEESWFNKHEFGVVVLNYGYPEGADRIRAIINEKSTSQVIYNLYPGADMLKKYAISVCCISIWYQLRSCRSCTSCSLPFLMLAF